MKKYKIKYSTGGQIAASLATLIPGYGQIISPLIGMADQMLTKPDQIEPKSPPLKLNTNVYGNTFKLGGFVGDGFKNRPYHKDGNIVEGDYDIEDFSDADIKYLKSKGYTFEKIK